MARRRSIVWSGPARLDLLQAHAFLRARSPRAAREFAAAVRDAVRRLPRLPRMGSPLDASPLVGEFRAVVIGHHRVIYRIDEERIVIFRIWDCRRDPDQMWSE